MIPISRKKKFTQLAIHHEESSTSQNFVEEIKFFQKSHWIPSKKF